MVTGGWLLLAHTKKCALLTVFLQFGKNICDLTHYFLARLFWDWKGDKSTSGAWKMSSIYTFLNTFKYKYAKLLITFVLHSNNSVICPVLSKHIVHTKVLRPCTNRYQIIDLWIKTRFLIMKFSLHLQFLLEMLSKN